MKTLLTVLFFALFQFTQAQNLQANQMRFRTWNQDGSITAWDTSKCNVPIEINAEYQLLTCHNALDQTFSIKLSDNGRYYNSQDYEGLPVAIAIHHNPDGTYNVLFHYDKVWLCYNGAIVVSYDYQYIHARKIKQ